MSSLSSSMISSFLSTYQIKELGFSMTFIATFDTVITILGIPVLFFIGKLSRRFSYSKLLYVSFILKFVEFFMLAFTMPQNGAYLFTAYKVLAIFSGALDIVTVSNIIFDVVPYSERAAGLSLKAVFVGLTGFLTVLAASPFLDYVQKNGNTFLGINAYAQQFLAASAGFIMLITIIYYHFFCKKLLEDTADVSAE
jgi:Na+/melibiose symporter-like transporter